MHAGRDAVELMLALGATRSEATGALVRRAIKLSLQPIVNQMSVMGIVSVRSGERAGCVIPGHRQCAAWSHSLLLSAASHGDMGAPS